MTDSTLLIGDFNSNKIWDYKSRIANHTDVVNYLYSRNIHSLYHRQYKENHGVETKPTLFMHRKIDKPYHVDYCFASERSIRQGYILNLGDYNDWLKLSDHMPVVVDIELTNNMDAWV